VVFFVVALVLLFYVSLNSCASYVESWIGMLAPQVNTLARGPARSDLHLVAQVDHQYAPMSSDTLPQPAAFVCRSS
jgi:hypothetical protein